MRGPFSRHVTFQLLFLPLPCVIRLPPLYGPRGLLSFPSSTHHPPRASFPPCQPPAKRCPSHLLPCLLRLVSFAMCLSQNPSHASPLLSRPHSFGPFTPFPYPPLSVLAPHAYPLSQSSYSRWQHEKSSISRGAELARSSSIPRKKLLKRLVVVRHRLRHNGDVLQ